MSRLVSFGTFGRKFIFIPMRILYYQNCKLRNNTGRISKTFLSTVAKMFAERKHLSMDFGRKNGLNGAVKQVEVTKTFFRAVTFVC